MRLESCIKPVFFGLCLWISSCALLSEEQHAAKGERVVRVSVSVTDPLNRFVTGLGRNSFRIYENGVEREITFFTSESAPMTLAVLCDVSEPEIERVKKQISTTLQRLVEQSPRNEFFQITNIKNPGGNIEIIRRQNSTIEQVPPSASIAALTGLEQALFTGLECIQKGSGKKGLITVTSRPQAAIVRAYDLIAKLWNSTELPAYQFYSLVGTSINFPERRLNHMLYVMNSSQDLSYYLDLAYSDLRSRYVLGFVSSSDTSSSGYKLSAKVDPSGKLPQFTVRMTKPY